MPHKLPSCHKCGGTGWKAAKNKFCKHCVCKKCDGSGWKYDKNKPCKKMKLKD
jgi:hypothetical protein